MATFGTCVLASLGQLSPYNSELTTLADAAIVESAAGNVGFPLTASTQLVDYTFYRPFGKFYRNDVSTSSGTLKLTVGDVTFTQTSSYAPGTNQATFVTAMVKTSTIWYDQQRFEVRYVVRDSFGSSVVSTSNMQAQILLQAGALSSTTTCTSFTSSTGVGACYYNSLSLDSWFSLTQSINATATVRITYSGTQTALSSAMPFTLAQRVNLTYTSTFGMSVDINQSPLFAGENVVATIYAYTQPYDLNTWGLDFNYNNAVLKFVSVALVSTTYFNSPTVNSGTAGLVSMVTSVKDGQTVRGSQVSLVTVTLQVRTTVAAGTYASAVSVRVRDMVNSGGFGYVNNLAATVNDYRGSGFSSGTIVVRDLITMGIYAYASVNEVVNLVILNPSLGAQDLGLVVKRIDNLVQSTDTTVTSSAVCTHANPSGSQSLTLSTNCVTRVDATNFIGSANVTIVIQYGTFSSSFSFRIWAPLSARVVFVNTTESTVTLDLNRSSKVTLQQLYRTDCNPVYQQVKFSVLSDLGGIDLQTMSPIDVTANVQVIPASRTNSIVTIQGNVVRGAGVGVENLVLNGSTVTNVVNGTVTVQSGHVNVSTLDVSLVTAAIFQKTIGSTVTTVSSNVTAQAVLAHMLNYEGASGQVFVYANFADGSRMEVTKQSGLSVISLATADLNVTGGSNSGWAAQIPTGASSKCGYMVRADWNTCADIDLNLIQELLSSSQGLVTSMIGAGFTSSVQLAITDLQIVPCEFQLRFSFLFFF
jgi:hypothetical protein